MTINLLIGGAIYKFENVFDALSFYNTFSGQSFDRVYSTSMTYSAKEREIEVCKIVYVGGATKVIYATVRESENA
jgi:hypothetical protein